MSPHSLLLIILLSLLLLLLCYTMGLRLLVFRVPFFFPSPFLSVEEYPFLPSAYSVAAFLCIYFFSTAFFSVQFKGCLLPGEGACLLKKKICGLLWRIICGSAIV